MRESSAIEQVEADVLVLGSGIAGLSYAIKMASHGKVLLITKKEDTEANTNYAQGGIAAVMDPLDSFEAHMQDTLASGAGLSDPVAVRLLVEGGPERVRELIEYGVQFTYETEQKRTLSLAREGGHSARRIVRADDLTGRAIEQGLLSAADRAGVEIREHFFAIDLWMTEDRSRCLGAVVLDRELRRPLVVRSTVTYLATGGCGQAFRFTTNPPIATGDGIAMAFRAGATIANLEFIQFHPTALYPVDKRPFLISEAVRGEGAVLRDGSGARFMSDHGATELAARDVVARAIDAEMRRSGDPHVWLDCRPIPEARFVERFPNILRTCRERGLSPPRDFLPVVPAAHYMCGGVSTDLWGRTTIDRLLAVGEVACTGVHGANRLASNSLLEAVVFADRAAEVSVEMVESRPLERDPTPPPVAGTVIERRDGATRETLRRILWEGAGIVRTEEGMAQAAADLSGLASQLRRDSVAPGDVETRNLHLVASLIVECARRRKESRGLHFSLSHPETDPSQRHDTTLSIETTPVA